MATDPPRPCRVCIYGETLLFRVRGCGRMGCPGCGVSTLSTGGARILGWKDCAWGIAISDGVCIVMGSG